jgi:hypothetical protein
VTPLSMSGQEWVDEKRGTWAQWRAACARDWAAIRSGEHWHGGVPCEQVAMCPRDKGPRQWVS